MVMEESRNSLPAKTEVSTCKRALPPTPTSRKKKSKNARRFSDEQIKSLETIFELETKLETRKKLQVAKDLGLQPRQVAIWFQNRRARWKSKQIEQEYRVLKSNYDNLNQQFESLKKENRSLLAEVKRLNNLLQLQDPSDHDQSKNKYVGKTDKETHSDSGRTKSDECRVNKNCCNEDSKGNEFMYADDRKDGTTTCFGQNEEPELIMNLNGKEETSLATEKLCSLGSGGLFDQSCDTPDWWDFWT